MFLLHLCSESRGPILFVNRINPVSDNLFYPNAFRNRNSRTRWHRCAIVISHLSARYTRNRNFHAVRQRYKESLARFVTQGTVGEMYWITGDSLISPPFSSPFASPTRIPPLFQRGISRSLWLALITRGQWQKLTVTRYCQTFGSNITAHHSLRKKVRILRGKKLFRYL